MTRDPEKRRATKRRYLERRKVSKYGVAAASQDMRGRHGRHARGAQNGRWNSDERRPTAHGYIAVRVPVDHPHAWGPLSLKNFRYAYEHVVVMMGVLGRPLSEDETVHHRNGDKTDNRVANLELLTRSNHAKHHDEQRGRDSLGRFPKGGDPSEWPEDMRVRQWPEVRSRQFPASTPVDR